MLAEYGIGSWDSESWGNHRALVEVLPQAAQNIAVHLILPWRRHDKEVEKKGIFIRFATTGKSVSNLWLKHVDNEVGDIIFAPCFGPGVYEIYYMVYAGQTRAPYPEVHYIAPHNLADAAWLDAVATELLPEATLLRLEACSELHSFFPMEVIATAAETRELCQRYQNESFLLFGEPRERSIRMKDFLPASWVLENKAFQELSLEALQGEYLSFQAGVFPHKPQLPGSELRCHFSDFYKHPGRETQDTALPGAHFTCFQLEGTDCHAQLFQRSVSPAYYKVQALWFGVAIPPGLKEGSYTGTLSVQIAEETADLPIKIKVLGASIADYGDAEPERMTRLRWLNSTLGTEPKVTKPFTPVRRRGNCLQILGRELELGAMGLPAQIRSFFTPELTGIGQLAQPILSQPLEFVVSQDGQALTWQEKTPLQFLQADETSISWTQQHATGDLLWSLQASLEFDGCLTTSCCLTAQNALELTDITLLLSLPKDIVKYRLGLGYEGQESQEPINWEWDVAHKGQDAIWLGKENAGIQILLRDEQYRRPLNTNFYRVQPLKSPNWDNCGRGGIHLEKEGPESYRLRCYSGTRHMQPGENLHFIFRLLITPFKIFDCHKQWNNRFIHRQVPPMVAQVEGASVINIHHANPLNPYINYPFLRAEAMQSYIAEAQRLGLKVCVYYTVRELSNHAPEIFALRSLGTEIFSKGTEGGGHSWLQEHFGTNYLPAWHVFDYDCVAVINSGASRWHNFYVEGIHWLAKNIAIDGVYIDDLAVDRQIMQRVRRVLDLHRPDAIIDMHSANQFNPRDGYVNSINLYLEHLPYIDRIWFGEYFHYKKGPDYWMTEVAGLPFGVGGEMLQNGGNLWRGLLYGMTSRCGHTQGDPRPVWRIWQDFGIASSEMLGYWTPNCPLRTNSQLVLATCYKKKDTVLITIASWEKERWKLALKIDWHALQFDPEQYELYLPLLEGIQQEASYRVADPIWVNPGEGIVAILRRNT